MKKDIINVVIIRIFLTLLQDNLIVVPKNFEISFTTPLRISNLSGWLGTAQYLSDMSDIMSIKSGHRWTRTSNLLGISEVL